MATMPEVPQSEWDEAERKSAFWEEHAREFEARFAGQYVAVSDLKVVGTSPDLDGLQRELYRQGLALRDVWVRYVGGPAARVL